MNDVTAPQSQRNLRMELRRHGYELADCLGAGGMGEVWCAHSVRLDRDVAIKRMTLTGRSSHETLLREARAIARLSHPAIVQVYDVLFSSDGSPLVVMELLRGHDLGHELERSGRLPAVAAVSLMLPILGGLDAAHQRGLVHGDVKPENIFLTHADDGTPMTKLLDFGVARTISAEHQRSGFVFGTPEYMPPEQLAGQAIGTAADQWAACATLYATIVGHPPFHGASSLPALFDRVRRAPLPYPRNTAMDARLFSILARGTRKPVDARYASIGELRAVLVNWISTRSPRRSGASLPLPVHSRSSR